MSYFSTLKIMESWYSCVCLAGPFYLYLTGVCCFFCRAREALRQCLPDQLKDTTFAQVLKDDTTTKRWLAQLVKNLQEGQVTDPRGIPLPPQWLSLLLTSPEEYQQGTAQQHCFYERLSKERLLPRYFSGSMCKQLVWALCLWMHSFKEVHICCLTMCSTASLQIQ